ncbi:MAG TPA: cytochrome C biogenesis protein [Nitrospiraceae bacterium]|nr:cytochrome C biogenesis protein [Nitrospiraceae bacterium]
MHEDEIDAMKDISFPLAFLAGVLSFLSPCVLPLVPSYVSFITGISFEDLTEGVDRKKIRRLTVTNSLSFVLGFSTVFMGLGTSSSSIGRFFFAYQEWIRIIGGIIIIFFGLFVAGFLKIQFLTRDRKMHLSGKPAGYVGTFLVGMTFAAGWTPCIGPMLGTILLYASTKGSAFYGFKLLAVYSLGLALPFFASSLAMNSFLSYSRKLLKYMRVIMVVSGLLLIIFGIILLTNRLRELSSLMPNIGISF